MSDDWLTEDPFADSDDPAAQERAERRAERERKRQEKAEKEGAPPPKAVEQAKPAAPPPPKRSPEQEFWNEEPTPPPTPPAGGASERAGENAEQPSGERKRRGFLRRRKDSPEPDAVPPPAPPTPAAGPTGPADAGEPPALKEPEWPASTPSAAGRTVESKSAPPAEKPETPAAEAAPPAAKPKPAAAKDPAPPAPKSEPPASAPPAADRPGSQPAAADRPPAAAPLDATVEHTLPDPIPAPEDPTLPATGESPVPDPDAPQPTGEHPVEPPSDEHDRLVPAPVPVPVPGDEPVADPAQPVTGQTSEEWAAVPSARADWEDFASSDYHDEGNPEMAGAARQGRRPGDGGNRRGGVLGAITGHPFRIALLILLIVVLWFLNSLFQPFHGDAQGRVAVRIPKGSSVSEVGELLEKRGVISGGTFGIIDGSTLFQIRTTMAGKRSDLIAGPHTLKKDMSYGEAIDALSEEPSKKQAAGGPRDVTVPEGYTRGQAAQIIREDGVPGNYKKATVKSKYLKPAEYGGKGAKTLEGFLFPDTFNLKRKAPVKDLVQLQLEDFKRKIKQVNMKYAKSKNLTVYDVVTIASMIEREAGVPKQRKLVASVIYNRLHEGIPLGIDATIRYATGNFEKPLTESELATDSPYNTRLNAGLPPGPINSPGLASLQAAAHPAKTDFIYYVNDPDSCNELTFTKTNEEFEAAVQKYEQAREANGGNAPSTCKE